ncbi:MAG TPA: alpha/beta fold hydrolase [Streptosporangiaceae bacterium]
MTAGSEGWLDRPGARLRYQTAGPADGPALVLLHGFGLDRRMWAPQAGLAGRFFLVTYDLRGFGASAPMDPGVPYTHADDLFALLDHLGAGAVALAGLSFGGLVALQAAAQSPDRVRALVLMDALLPGVRWDPECRAGFAEVDRQVSAGGVTAGQQAWLHHPLFAGVRRDPGLAAQLAVMVSDYPGQHWLGQDPETAGPRPAEVLGRLTMPALVVAGEQDMPCFLEMTGILAGGIPGAEHTLIPGAGHMVNMERPAEVNALLTSFLAKAAHGGDDGG